MTQAMTQTTPQAIEYRGVVIDRLSRGAADDRTVYRSRPRDTFYAAQSLAERRARSLGCDSRFLILVQQRASGGEWEWA